NNCEMFCAVIRQMEATCNIKHLSVPREDFDPGQGQSRKYCLIDQWCSISSFPSATGAGRRWMVALVILRHFLTPRFAPPWCLCRRRHVPACGKKVGDVGRGDPPARFT